MKTSELIGPALDWAVVIASGVKPADIYITRTRIYRWTRDGEGRLTRGYMTGPEFLPSSAWESGGPIIERENISVIRCDDESIPDAGGFCQGKYQPVWAAVIGERHSTSENHGGQGDYWGLSYHVDEGAVVGPTPLVAAMRVYVASKLGDEVDIPSELL